MSTSISTPLSDRSGPYVPRRHEKFLNWAMVFTGRIARDPESAKLTPEIAAELSAAFDIFERAYFAANSRTTRTPLAVSRMNDSRKVLEKMCRAYGQRIKNDHEIPDSVKLDLYLRRRTKSRQSISVLDSRPCLSIPSTAPGRHVLRWSDDLMGLALRKPKDAAALQLFAVVADGICADARQARYVGTYTKQPIKVDWPMETAGKTISYFGRWITASGKEGPWSLPASMQIAFGGLILKKIDEQRAAIRAAA